MESNEKQITVTSPLLPNLDELNTLLKEIWDSKWITNNGSFHQKLEKELAAYLQSLSFLQNFDIDAGF